MSAAHFLRHSRKFRSGNVESLTRITLVLRARGVAALLAAPTPPATGAQATHPPPDPPAALPSAAPPIFSSTTTYSPPNFPVESGKNFYPAAPTTPDRDYRPPQHHASTPTSITRASSSTFPSVATYHYKPEFVAPTTPEPATTGAPATPAMPATDSTSSQHSSVDFVLGPPPSSSPAAAKVDSALLELHHPDAPSSTGDRKTDASKRHATASAFPTSTATPTTPSALLFPGTPLSTELAKLSAMASQLSDSIGKLVASRHTSKLAASTPAPARVVSQVFDESPTPSSCKGTGIISPASSASSTALVAPQAFAELPTPNSCNGTGSTSPASSTPSTDVVVPQLFGEMPRPRYCPRKYSSPLHYYQERETPVVSTCVPDGTSNLSEQNLVEMHQSYGFSNLHRRSIFPADGTEHGYYMLPDDDPLQQATPPTSLSAAERVGVTTLQQQDERACSCPVLTAYDSFVTSSNQVSSEHCMRALRMLWDPGATTFHVLFPNAAGTTKLQCRCVYNPELVHVLAVSLGARKALISESDAMCYLASELRWTEVNAIILFVLAIACSTGKAKLQWDPGIVSSSSRFVWLVSGRHRGQTGKALVWLQSQLFSVLQLQMSKTSPVWDQSILSLMHMMWGKTAVQTSWTSMTYSGITSYEFDQWEFFNQQGVPGNYSAQHVLLFSHNCLQIWDIGTFFTTFLPP